MLIVSVIVPVYNVERYLPRCIDSILSQSFSDFELILVDDGSPDQCGAICDEYAVNDERIRVIHQENGKISAARNAGLDAAQGEWIAFIDSDDWIHRDYLKILMSETSEDTDMVICGCRITSNDMETDQEYTGTLFKDTAFDNVYSDRILRTRAWGRLYRRTEIGGLRYVPGTEPLEDAYFNELLYRKNMKIRVTDQQLYYYYMRPDSAIHAPMGQGLLKSAETLYEQIGGIHDPEKRIRIIKRCYKYTFSVRYSEMFSADYGAVKKQCRNLIKRLTLYLPELSIKDRAIMWVFSKFPAVYRAWRILGDPTLLNYERNSKKAENERRKQRRKRTVES